MEANMTSVAMIEDTVSGVAVIRGTVIGWRLLGTLTGSTSLVTLYCCGSEQT